MRLRLPNQTLTISEIQKSNAQVVNLSHLKKEAKHRKAWSRFPIPAAGGSKFAASTWFNSPFDSCHVPCETVR
jgi:hypothetical protein